MAARSKKAKKEIVLETVKKQKIGFIDLQFTDLQGLVKKVSVPASKLEDALEDGVIFDGSSVDGYATINESDFRAVPDPDTFLVYPWTQGDMKTASFICNIVDPEQGKQFEGDPRYRLQQQLQKAYDQGYDFMAGPEFEFFLFHLNDQGNPTLNVCDQWGYFDQVPHDRSELVRRQCTVYLNQMGFDVEAEHHEVAAGQQEIDLKYNNAMIIADRIAQIKFTIKTVARMRGMHASFMPKPLRDVNGSGMHVHQSLTGKNKKNGTKNIFYDPNSDDGLSDKAMYYMGGLLTHAKETTAVYNSYVNSYKRLSPGFEAPVYVAWANKNRSALVRVPSGRGKATRLELRNPDPAGNPYMMFALMLASGMDGMKKKIIPADPIETDLFKMTHAERKKKGIDSLPGNLGHSLELFRESKFIKQVLGDHICHHFMVKKKREWDKYRMQVTQWEIDNFLARL